MQDIRWHQRFRNFRKALRLLNENIQYIKDEEEIDWELEEEDFEDLFFSIANILKQGLIQSFEFTFELAWNVMKDYAEFQGNTEIKGSRDAVRYSAQVSLVENGHIWMQMIKSRTISSHTYDEDTANEIMKDIIFLYQKEFEKFENKMESLRSGEQGNLFE